MRGLRGRENRHWILFQENLEPFHMIAVFVRQEDAAKRCRIDPEVSEPQRELFRAQSGIDHQTHATALDDRRVSATTAAKHRETNHMRRVAARSAGIKDFACETMACRVLAVNH
jgi:hypothetical protein